MSKFKDWTIKDKYCYHNCTPLLSTRKIQYSTCVYINKRWRCSICGKAAPKELNNVCTLAKVSKIASQKRMTKHPEEYHMILLREQIAILELRVEELEKKLNEQS